MRRNVLLAIMDQWVKVNVTLMVVIRPFLNLGMR